MPWIHRSSRAPVPHKCKLPPLTKGHVAYGTFKELAGAGDEWACRRCGAIYQVDRIIAVPPGFRGEKAGLRSTYLRWSRMGGRVWG